MSKLYFRYGAMNCGKSALLMQVAYNYNEKGKRVIVIKPEVDVKGGDCLVSRIGLKRTVDICLSSEDSLKKYYDVWIQDVSCILVDEAQFLEPRQVEELWYFAKICDIPVICYGLKSDFQSHLFEGSKRLLELADEIEEILNICGCGKRAKFNARYVDGKFTLKGDTILIDGENSTVEYRALCGKCYLKECENVESDN